MATPESDSPSSLPDPASPVAAKETKQERRARRKKSEKERMPQHGKGLAQMYKDAVEKRAGKTDAGG